MSPNYWVVGATWDGTDLYDRFVDRGYWQMGWADADKPDLAALRDRIRPGDRIAIKKMLGHGASNIAIRAQGIVTEVDSGDHRVYVRWLTRDVDRDVPGHGCFGTIHGPFSLSGDATWLGQAFLI